jgi:phage replication O-like protein O
MATAPSFSGFQFPTTTPVPDEVFDLLLPQLNGAELKVLLYICRRTFGFKKQWDMISLNQIASGITTKDGRVLDRGTGLSKRHVQRALKRLEERHIITVNRRRDETGLNEINAYSLHFQRPVPAGVGQRRVETTSEGVETGCAPGVGTPQSVGVGTAGADGRDTAVPRVETCMPTTRNSKQETGVQQTGTDSTDKIQTTERKAQDAIPTKTTEPREHERESDFQPTWNNTLQRLKEQVPASTFATWIKDTMLVRMERGTAYVLVGSQLVKDWLERRLYQSITRTLSHVLNQEGVQVQFVVA